MITGMPLVTTIIFNHFCSFVLTFYLFPFNFVFFIFDLCNNIYKYIIFIYSIVCKYHSAYYMSNSKSAFNFCHVNYKTPDKMMSSKR